MPQHAQRSAWARAVSIGAMAFGPMTLKEGGSVLFIHGAARSTAGAYVPFVRWFNFLPGFACAVAGVGLWTAIAVFAWRVLPRTAARRAG